MQNNYRRYITKEESVMLVTATQTADVWSVDKTFAEIQAHIQGGGTALLYDGTRGQYLNFGYLEDDAYIMFSHARMVNSTYVNPLGLAGSTHAPNLVEFIFYISSDDTIQYAMQYLSVADVEAAALETTDKVIYRAINEVNAKASTQSDWSVNDETDIAFVKNRPFYTTDPEYVEVCNGTFEFLSKYGNYAQLDLESAFDYNEWVEGNQVNITIDGTVHNAVMKSFGDDMDNQIYCGNAYMVNTSFENTGEAFLFFEGGGWNTLIIDSTETANHNVIISIGKNKIVQLDEKFLPDTTKYQSDWSVNDETDLAFVKNRPFYTTDPVEKVLVEETTVEIGEDLFAQISSNLYFTVGQTYKVTFNGTEYECVAWAGGSDHGVYVGNGSIYGGNDSDGELGGNGEPFSCDSYNDYTCYLNTSETGSYTIKITTMQPEVIQLDEKYISYKPGLKVEGKTFTVNDTEVIAAKGAEIFNDYANNIATGSYSHAEGRYTKATGDWSSHAEGGSTIASGHYSHAEGCSTIASGNYSHAEGCYAKASGWYSHAEGFSTTASMGYQHVQGRYNIEDTANKYAHIVGNGTSDSARSNAHTLDWEGNAEFQGDVKANACGGENPISLVETANKVSELKSQLTQSQFMLTDTENNYRYIIQMKNGKMVSYCACVSIDVQTLPTNIDFSVNGPVDTTGMVVIATCEDGSERDISSQVTCTDIANGEFTVKYIEMGIEYSKVIAAL